MVEMTDVEWFSISDEQRAELIVRYRDKALKDTCNVLSIFAIPDPIFPIHGITVRKRVHNEKLINDGKAWGLTCTHHAELVPRVWTTMDEAAQKRTLKTIRDVLAIKGNTNPGRYEILLPNGDGTNTVVERGRV